MIKYKHWLKIDGYTGTQYELKQYQEIKHYLEKYPEAKATIFQLESNLFHRVVLLECEQNYDELDMFVNSLSHPLRRLTQKPADIINPKEFKIPNRLIT
jgi:hypothetical protein